MSFSLLCLSLYYAFLSTMPFSLSCLSLYYAFLSIMPFTLLCLSLYNAFLSLLCFSLYYAFLSLLCLSLYNAFLSLLCLSLSTMPYYRLFDFTCPKRHSLLTQWTVIPDYTDDRQFEVVEQKHITSSRHTGTRGLLFYYFNNHIALHVCWHDCSCLAYICLKLITRVQIPQVSKFAGYNLQDSHRRHAFIRLFTNNTL